jgi:broad specificity phosphatase PhoE
MGQVLLVRHAQAQFGTDDYDRLSDLGREQSRLLGEWFARGGRGFDVAVTGNMKRHRETAAGCFDAMPTSLRPKDDWRADPGFNEYDADQVVMRNSPEFADSEALRAHLRQSENPRRAFQDLFTAAMHRWMAGEHDGEYRESWGAFQGRCVAALKRVIDESGASTRAVVFTSGGPIAAICQHLLGLSAQRTLDVNVVLVNCATTGLLHQPNRVSLSHLNSYSHLEQPGNTKMVTYR